MKKNFDYEEETPEESWNYFTNYSNLEDFLKYPAQLKNIEKIVEGYIEEIPHMFTIKIEETDKEVIKRKFLRYIDQLLKDSCLNCFHHHKRDERKCRNCGWVNMLDDTPSVDITPITIKTYTFNDFSPKVAYPPVDAKHLTHLPEKLRDALLIFLKHPEKLNKNDKDNIYHNLWRTEIAKFKNLYRKYFAKAKFAEFIQDSNFDKI